MSSYSWNEGTNWTSLKFWKHHVEVENVITEPRGAGTEFIMYYPTPNIITACLY